METNLRNSRNKMKMLINSNYELKTMNFNDK